MLWATTILALGAWWLYLILTYGEKIQRLNEIIQVEAQQTNIIRMVKWEGLTFLVLLILLSSALFFLYLKDQKKTKSMGAFFAGLTHELKTPLASIRLQTDVIKETIETLINDPDKQLRLKKLSSKLQQDTLKLENQMDKILQLSRIERGGNLNNVDVNLIEYIKTTQRKWAPEIDLKLNNKIEKDGNKTIAPHILADEFALELILRNLFENTLNHSPSKVVNITLKEPSREFYTLEYSDEGVFEGDINQIGELFYKHNSSKGSGIGIYLIKKLINKMGGHLSIKYVSSERKNLIFELEFISIISNEKGQSPTSTSEVL